MRSFVPGPDGNRRRKEDAERRLLLAQAGYFCITGIWPILEIKSFQKITGPKTDEWLVKTVGALVAVVGAALAVGALRRRVSPEVRVLAAGSSVALAGIDVVYVSKGRISPVYLLDAVLQGAFLVGLAAMGRRRRKTRSPLPAFSIVERHEQLSHKL